MKKKIILKSSILAVAAGLSVFAINSVFADELPVQFMGVNDFHGALEQTGTARLEGKTVKNAGTAPLLATDIITDRGRWLQTIQKCFTALQPTFTHTFEDVTVKHSINILCSPP